MNTEYRQFTDQIAADASRSAAAMPPPSDFAWLAGEWRSPEQAVEFANTAYGVSLDGDPYLIHNSASGMWILVLGDPAAFGILIGLGLRAGSARFSGDVTIDDTQVRLRQTLRRVQDATIEIRTEKQLDGNWQLMDLCVLERSKPPN